MFSRSTLSLALITAIAALAGGCNGSSPVVPADAGLADAPGEGSPAADTRAAGDTGGATADAGPVVLDPGIISSASPYGEHEPTVAVTSDGRVAVAWVAGVSSGFQIRYRISTDRGVTFAPEADIPMPAGTNICSNSSMAVDQAGGIRLAYGCEKVSASGTRSNVQVLVASSTKGSTTFGDGVMVTDPTQTVDAYDQPRVAVIGTGSLLVTYSHFSTTNSQEIAAWSDDGLTWTRTPILGNRVATDQNMARIYASPTDARVWVAILLDTNHDVRLCRSPDGGRTWPEADQHNLAQPAGHLSLDLAITGEGKDLWVLHGRTGDVPSRRNNIKLDQVQLVHSGDGGDTFDAPVSIDDAAVGKYLMLANVVRDNRGGLNLTYYAGAEPGDKAASYRRRRSTDGGKSFGPSLVVHQPLTFDVSRGSATWLGDYEGVAAAEGHLYLSYVDSSGSKARVAFYRTSLP